MSLSKQIEETIRNELKGKKNADYDYNAFYKKRLIDYRKEKDAVVRVEKPTNLSRAKKLGYAAKQGILLVRIRVRKGSGLHRKPVKGRRPKRMGVAKLTPRISTNGMAEQKASVKYPNCEVINSYLVGEDGKNKYYEAILYERDNPAIISDKKRNWVCEKQHKGRAFRGLTSAQKKSRGLQTNKGKGRGSEKARPSLRAHNRKQK
ncbi:MAG: 50S ribosomal protein L15e [Candidatus Diapherotrites archaeon]|nr:50S ribosomal protein L15e [Candidatus Diapherotrites archaeon]